MCASRSHIQVLSSHSITLELRILIGDLAIDIYCIALFCVIQRGRCILCSTIRWVFCIFVSFLTKECFFSMVLYVWCVWMCVSTPDGIRKSVPYVILILMKDHWTQAEFLPIHLIWTMYKCSMLMCFSVKRNHVVHLFIHLMSRK